MEGNDEPQISPASPPAAGSKRPVWATLVGVLCIAVAAVQIAAAVGLALLAPGWQVELDVGAFAFPALEHTVPTGAFLLGPWVGFVCAGLALWLLLEGGVGLLRRAPRARPMLMGYAGIVIAGKVWAAIAGAPLFGGTAAPAAVGLAWPVLVLAWMLRPTVARAVAGWPRARGRWRRRGVAVLAGTAALAWGLSLLPWEMMPLPEAWDYRPLAVADPPLRGGLDVTFLVVADVHCAADPAPPDGMSEEEKLLAAQTKAMSEMAGRPWPAEAGGQVGEVGGVIVAGDLTENGLPEQWEQFERWFAGPGGKGVLPFPAYVCTGNHDRVAGPGVLARVTRRHGGDFYAWDWGDLHVVSLGEYPTVQAINWLRRDLAAVGRRRPVALFMHYPPPGPYSDVYWINKPDHYARLAQVLAGFNVIALFHGHHHAAGPYPWEGLNVYNVGVTKRGMTSFAVVHVTDTTMTVGYWNWVSNRWDWWHRRPAAPRPPR